jgi:predicted DNA-binding transcriptional regulator YafY
VESAAGRLLRVLSLLQSRPTWTAEELAERLEVTTRTVRRDITRLRELGYPVVAAPGRFGGYQLGRGGAHPPRLLTHDEAVAVGLQAAAHGGVSGIEEAAVAALAKLEQVLPVTLRDRLQALQAATVPLRGPEGPAVQPDALVVVAQGCRRLERLRFGYVDGSGQASERTVEPYRLVHHQRRWYLVARDRDRDAWRTFRMDRIREPVLTGHRFVRTEEPDAAAMVAEGLALGAYSIQAVVLLLIPPEEAAREVPRTVGTLEPHEEGTLLRIGGNDLRWISTYLLTLQCPFRVIDPPELRDDLRALARAILRDHR